MEVGATSFARNQSSVNKELSSDDLQKIILHTAQIGSLHDICTEKAKKNRQICIEISEVKQEWTRTFLFVSVAPFVTIFSYIGPFIVCLFAPTEVMYQGIRQIVLDGPRTVGFRNLIGNYFFSMDDIIWHRARRFIMRVLILPIPFLFPALFVVYLIQNNVLPHQNSLRLSHLFQPFNMLCYSCYFIQAFYYSFFVMKPSKWLTLYEELFHGNLPWRMLACARTSFLIISATFTFYSCFGVFLAYQFITYRLPNHKADPDIFLLIILFLGQILGTVFSSLIVTSFGLLVGAALVVKMIPIAAFRVAAICASGSSRLWELVNNRYLAIRLVVVSLDICISCLAATGGLLILRSAALGVVLFFQLGVTFLLSVENFPCVICFILASYYLWGVYYSFTKNSRILQ